MHYSFEVARAQIIVMDLSGFSTMNDNTKQTGMTKFWGQGNGREECHYHEREGGIVCKVGG